MKLKTLFIIAIPALIFFPVMLTGQQLRPGFVKGEYREMLLISARTSANPEYYNKYQAPEHFRKIYDSPAVGMDNHWDLWLNDQSVAVISIRGTTASFTSWLANYYCAMASAKGELKLDTDFTFKYELASNPEAAVHTGWLICTAYLSKDILPRIDSLYKAGVKDFIITGHSQGGAISYLLTAYFLNLRDQKVLPGDIRFKTYCSAAPKPGNLYFAYDYEARTQNGWAYNVVNSADWVPESPFSIQTTDDYNAVNPFAGIRPKIRKMKFPKNTVVMHLYNGLDKPTRKSRDNFEKYLGVKVSKYVKYQLPGFVPPVYYHSSNYVRTGTTIILLADENYYKIFPGNNKGAFAHHLHNAYLYLLDHYNPGEQ
jgi:Lipase (class 3)